MNIGYLLTCPVATRGCSVQDDRNRDGDGSGGWKQTTNRSILFRAAAQQLMASHRWTRSEEYTQGRTNALTHSLTLTLITTIHSVGREDDDQDDDQRSEPFTRQKVKSITARSLKKKGKEEKEKNYIASLSLSSLLQIKIKGGKEIGEEVEEEGKGSTHTHKISLSQVPSLFFFCFFAFSFSCCSASWWLPTVAMRYKNTPDIERPTLSCVLLLPYACMQPLGGRKQREREREKAWSARPFLLFRLVVVVDRKKERKKRCITKKSSKLLAAALTRKEGTSRISAHTHVQTSTISFLLLQNRMLLLLLLFLPKF